MKGVLPHPTTSQGGSHLCSNRTSQLFGVLKLSYPSFVFSILPVAKWSQSNCSTTSGPTDLKQPVQPGEIPFMLFCVWDSAFGFGTLPGAGVPCNYFLQCLWEEGGSPDGYSLLVPIFLHSLWRLEHVWRPCGAVLCVLSQFWFGRLLAESLLFLSQEEELVSSRDCVLTFWHPGFQSHGYSLLPYKIAFTLCQKKKKNHLKLGSRQKNWENIFSALFLCRDWLSIMSEQRLMCRFLSVRDANNSVRRDCPKDYGLLSSWTLTSFVSHPKILF